MRTLTLLIALLFSFATQAQQSLRDSGCIGKFGFFFKPDLSFGLFNGHLYAGQNYVSGSATFEYYDFKGNPEFGFEAGTDIIFRTSDKFSITVSPAYKYLSFVLTSTVSEHVISYTLSNNSSDYWETTYKATRQVIHFPVTLQYYYEKGKNYSMFTDVGIGFDVLLNDSSDFRFYSGSSSFFITAGVGYKSYIGNGADFEIEPIAEFQPAINNNLGYFSIGIKAGILYE